MIESESGAESDGLLSELGRPHEALRSYDEVVDRYAAVDEPEVRTDDTPYPIPTSADRVQRLSLIHI